MAPERTDRIDGFKEVPVSVPAFDGQAIDDESRKQQVAVNIWPSAP
jgi:hypothetical protein